MAEAGILHEDDRVELIEGEIVQMTAIGSRHAACVARLTTVLTRGVGDRAIVNPQNPLRLSQLSEPQPDVTLLRPRADYYAQSHPGPGDVLLLVEVSDASLPYDRGVKLPLYAEFSIPEVWTVDLSARILEACLDPAQGGYQEIRSLGPGDRLAPQAFPDIVVDLGKLLGA